MARGIVEIPVGKGKKELAWYVGSSTVAGTNNTNPVVSLKVERDADFVARRHFLVQWPPDPAAPSMDLALPPTAQAQLKDGATSRGLSNVALNATTLFPNTNVNRMEAAYLGLAAPFLIRGNNSLFVEVSYPGAGVTPWVGNLFYAMEGFKLYPNLAEEFPATVKQYAVPFDLCAQQVVQSPAAAPQNITGQTLTLTNNGEGKMLVKGMKMRAIDAAGVDRTDAILPWLGLNLVDSTSGTKYWGINTQPGLPQGRAFLPAPIMLMAGTYLPWSQTRYIDPNGSVQIPLTFSDIPAAVAFVNAIGAWPMTFHFTLFGALLPR